jgi:scyllo-inositol 2-dehydrogenase (NADP+)
MDPVTNEIRCAVVGCGPAFGMGKRHLEWLSMADGLTGVAACDKYPPNLEAMRIQFPHLRTYSDYGYLLADNNVDLVVIITPHNTHYELALQALQAGKHVVIEKPMCITVAEATELIDTAHANNVTLTIFHNRRHDGDFLAIKEVIDKGIIGDVFQVEAFMGDYSKPRDWWRSDKEISGGAFYDWGAHVVDWVLHFIPEKMEAVTGFFHKRVWDECTNEDQTQAIIRFEGGKLADIQISSIAYAGKPRFRILGTKGAIIDENKGSFKVITEHEGYPAELNIKYKETKWEDYYENLARHLVDGAPLEVTPESARRIIAVLETAEKSSASGKSEPVPFG